ncbi:bifunctional arginine demethylase and lysyl-hydroxylase JMJD6-like [Amphiura filiformis]|uniref:bifunctional arginine demethylase and lysyl-hydroxylase JMJD6-like n=1 Tax=Amphiura filiformis TaxID=82378 RepID=UPI003B21F636
MTKAAKVKEQLVRELIRLKRQSCRSGLKSGDVRQVFLNSCAGFQSGGSGRQSSDDQGTDLPSRNGSANSSDTRNVRPIWRRRLVTFTFALIPVLLGVLYVCHRAEYDWEDFMNDVRETPCIIENNFFIMEMARPLAPCAMCKNLTKVPIYYLIDKEEFLNKHAYSGRPAIISGATANWTAMDKFSFHFFRDLYRKYPGSFDKIEDECQFFPYNTDFTSLEEAFNMSDDQAAMREGEAGWYIGWSNCDQRVQTELRKHYERPYFIPPTSESSALDWMFMGGPGPGADIHIDNVDKPSWQAQISGKKTWQLIPPPECEDVCQAVEVTVNKGDIIIVDTNQWYHKTTIHPGEISITIGSEYD